MLTADCRLGDIRRISLVKQGQGSVSPPRRSRHNIYYQTLAKAEEFAGFCHECGGNHADSGTPKRVPARSVAGLL